MVIGKSLDKFYKGHSSTAGRSARLPPHVWFRVFNILHRTTPAPAPFYASSPQPHATVTSCHPTTLLSPLTPVVHHRTSFFFLFFTRRPRPDLLISASPPACYFCPKHLQPLRPPPPLWCSLRGHLWPRSGHRLRRCLPRAIHRAPIGADTGVPVYPCAPSVPPARAGRLKATCRGN